MGSSGRHTVVSTPPSRSLLPRATRPAGPAHAGPRCCRPGSTRLGMTFVRVPAGQFLMGASDEDISARADERPRHLVRITASFELGDDRSHRRTVPRLRHGEPATRPTRKPVGLRPSSAMRINASSVRCAIPGEIPASAGDRGTTSRSSR